MKALSFILLFFISGQALSYKGKIESIVVRSDRSYIEFQVSADGFSSSNCHQYSTNILYYYYLIDGGALVDIAEDAEAAGLAAEYASTFLESFYHKDNKIFAIALAAKMTDMEVEFRCDAESHKVSSIELL